MSDSKGINGGHLTNTSLKMIAIICMAIDHTGAVLLPELVFMRVIGRLAFPIFAFLLVEGFYHTSSRTKYLIRLGIFALVSEVPFDLAFFKSTMYINYQNIFFTLFLGLIAIWIYETFKEKDVAGMSGKVIGWPAVILVAAVSQLLNTDYGIIGIVTILIFYMFRDNKIYGLIGVGLFHGLIGVIGLTNMIQSAAALSMPIIALYNGKKGKSLKYGFYLFYPLHLLLLAGIDQLFLAN